MDCWVAGLSSPSLLFSKTENNKEEKKKERGVGKKLDTRIIFPNSQKCACSEKNKRGMLERFKSKTI